MESSQESGHKFKKDEESVKIQNHREKENFSHETIAKMVGTSVENVSRIAKEFSQGMEKVTTSIVVNMLKKIFPYKIISKFAGISVENVLRIAEENNLGYK